MRKKNNLNQGFTLIELLLVIGIIAALAVIVFVALDPAKRFADARDARRIADMESILSTVHQYIVDHKGAIPEGIDSNEKMLGLYSSCVSHSGGCNANDDTCLDLSKPLSKYLKSIPYDPQIGSAEITQYTIL